VRLCWITGKNFHKLLDGGVLGILWEIALSDSEDTCPRIYGLFNYDALILNISSFLFGKVFLRPWVQISRDHAVHNHLLCHVVCDTEITLLIHSTETPDHCKLVDKASIEQGGRTDLKPASIEAANLISEEIQDRPL
jgi:hypothetical protein